MFVTTLIAGLVLGGTYALVAMGLTLQYGISRIMNLAYGETIIAASFLAYVLSSSLDINPLIVCGEGKGAWVADALLVLREA